MTAVWLNSCYDEQVLQESLSSITENGESWETTIGYQWLAVGDNDHQWMMITTRPHLSWLYPIR